MSVWDFLNAPVPDQFKVWATLAVIVILGAVLILAYLAQP